MKATRPAVTVTPITNEAGDLTHCEVRIGEAVVVASFSEPHTELTTRVQDATGVDLTVSEVMTVTTASRRQMEREAGRLKAAMFAMPAGAVAIVDGGMYFWLDAEKELVWDQWIILGKGEITPSFISCIGEIDTEELWDLAESIRNWLARPRTEQVDLQWLHKH